mgnify:CR=1 FL=1|jgi:hypothetical protein|tara:strand:+ start:114 stop:452 length:339 start_codon:yes stop_codon:yes gene_type:complete
MAQDFRRNLQDDLPTSHNDTNSLLWTGGDYDAVIGCRLANITTSPVTVDVYIRNSSTDYYLGKNIPIPAGGAIELIDAGSKVVMQNGDVLYGIASAGSAVDAIVSVVDTISS